MLAITEAGAEDKAAITDLWRVAGLTRPWNDPAADFMRAIAGSSSCVLVGTINDHPIATVMVGYDGHRGWLYYLAVEPAMLRKGHGTTMVKAACDWLTKVGAPKAELMLRDGNPATHFYKALGWTREPVTVWSSRLTQETE